MAADDLQFLGVLSEHLGSGLGDVSVRGSVETVLSDGILLVILVGKSVHEALCGHGLMEGSIKYGDLRGVGHELFACFDTHQVCGIVEGSQGEAVSDGLLAGFVDHAAGGELISAVEHSVAYGSQLAHASENAVVLVHQSVEDVLDGIGVVLHRGFDDELVSADLGVGQHGSFDADLLDKALAQKALVVHVQDLVLQ